MGISRSHALYTRECRDDAWRRAGIKTIAAVCNPWLRPIGGGRHRLQFVTEMEMAATVKKPVKRRRCVHSAKLIVNSCFITVHRAEELLQRSTAVWAMVIATFSRYIFLDIRTFPFRGCCTFVGVVTLNKKITYLLTYLLRVYVKTRRPPLWRTTPAEYMLNFVCFTHELLYLSHAPS